MKFMDIVHTTTYEKNGESKKKYTNVGTLTVFDDGGLGIRLDSIPVNFDGKLSVYEKKDRSPQHVAPQQSQPNPAYAQQQQQQQRNYGENPNSSPQYQQPLPQVSTETVPF